ncbi:MAG: acyltransferase [Bacteroidales bacterium]|nr:acyltransferase [Bacteroidales bacterium]
MSAFVSQRIEYIDAMRGFTMLLVVMAHVSQFCLGLHGYEGFSFNQMMTEFRMPLFFFVSGFVLFKPGYHWNLSNIVRFLQKKIMVQLITPTVFLFVSVYLRSLNFIDSLCNPMKEGYWFTYTLFVFFVFYIVAQCLLDVWQIRGWRKDVCLLLFACAVYVLGPLGYELPVNVRIIDALGTMQWQYFFYFMIGNRLRKHFERWERLMDGPLLVSVAIVVFFSFNIFRPFFWNFSPSLFCLLTALSGLLLVLAFFRTNAAVFSGGTVVGRLFQYVGKRTLDIYLLHYYFVFSNLGDVLPDFSLYKEPFSELLVSFAVSIIIIAFCLMISSILRLSPVIAHYGFGQKKLVGK